jgi:hypothetical protein
MSELLGVVLGVATGGGLSCFRSRRLRVVLLVPAVLLAGVVTSAVNGELGTALWAVFVSFDTLLAALGVAVGSALTSPRMRIGRHVQSGVAGWLRHGAGSH